MISLEVGSPCLSVIRTAELKRWRDTLLIVEEPNLQASISLLDGIRNPLLSRYFHAKIKVISADFGPNLKKLLKKVKASTDPLTTVVLKKVPALPNRDSLGRALPFVRNPTTTCRIVDCRISGAGERRSTSLLTSGRVKIGLATLLSLKSTLVIINLSFAVVLKILERKPKLQSAFLISTNLPVFRSNALTFTITFLHSCPYAPTFCTGEAPTVPGIKERFSSPHQPDSTQVETNLSQLIPASPLTMISFWDSESIVI